MLFTKGLHPEHQLAPSQSLWKKREVLVQEKTTEYISYDHTKKEWNRLVEEERQVTEVMHLEAKGTGEFAHKEVSRFSKTEQFNENVVNEEEGGELYLHLKSLEDEIEVYDSNIPRTGAGSSSGGRKQEEEEQQQQEPTTPFTQGEEQPDEAFMADVPPFQPKPLPFVHGQD